MLRTEDGLTLEAELAPAADGGAPRAAMVLCHPHPLHGGSMRSIVIGALFDGLPAHGVTCLRFNFRGVEGSEGVHADGDLERLDAAAALAHLADAVPEGTPIGMMGWSFGADVAASITDTAHGGWFLVAPPGRWMADGAAVAADGRPKHLVLGEHDQFREPADVEAAVAGWSNARVETIAGADHFFIGRTDRVVALAAEFIDAIDSPAAGPAAGEGGANG